MIHNHEHTEAWLQGVYDAIGAMQNVMGPSDYTFSVTDDIIEELGLDEDAEEEEEDA